MSIMDTDLANEKLDYDVIYKKKFDEINNQIEGLRCIVAHHKFDFRNLETNLNDIRSMLDFTMNEQNKLMNAIDILRMHLNNMLPDEEPKIYFDFN